MPAANAFICPTDTCRSAKLETQPVRKEHTINATVCFVEGFCWEPVAIFHLECSSPLDVIKVWRQQSVEMGKWCGGKHRTLVSLINVVLFDRITLTPTFLYIKVESVKQTAFLVSVLSLVMIH